MKAIEGMQIIIGGPECRHGGRRRHMQKPSSDTMRCCLEVNCMGVYYGLKYAPAHMPRVVTFSRKLGSGGNRVLTRLALT